MRAAVWHGAKDVRVEEVPDPVIQEPDDAIIEITTSGLCGSDLHLYTVLAPFMTEGDILGHEPMGIVRDVGPDAGDLQVGDRVVVPFQIACGHCFMCEHDLPTQCETTQVREQGTGAALFGFSKLYGSVPGGQAEYLRVPHAGYNPIKVAAGPPDDRFVLLSDVLPTAWQGVEYADVPDGGTLLVLGAGPIGDMASRIAAHRGYRVLTVDLVDERLERVRAHGAEPIDLREHDDVAGFVRDLTEGRGADSVLDAVGMEAHGSPAGTVAHRLIGLLPGALAEPLMKAGGVDRLGALMTAIDAVRRGGTVSLSGVYGGAADPLPLMTMFDKQLTLRMGQANVRRWVDDILPLLTDEDPLGVEDFASHRMPLAAAPEAYQKFHDKADGFCKVLFTP